MPRVSSFLANHKIKTTSQSPTVSRQKSIVGQAVHSVFFSKNVSRCKAFRAVVRFVGNIELPIRHFEKEPVGIIDAMGGLEYNSERVEEALEFARKNGFPPDAAEFLRVYWNDMDSNKHVNNVAYFRYYEAGRMAFIKWLAIQAKDSKERLWGKGQGLILASVSNKYLRPVFAPDMVMVVHKPVNVSERRFELESVIWSFKERAPVGKGTASFAAYDYDALKAMPMPKGMHKQLEDMLKQGQEKSKL